MTVPIAPEMFRAESFASDNSIGVDRENNVIRGYVVAEEGRTKTPGRGEFDMESLQVLAQLGNEQINGVRVRFQHPSMSDDGLGKYMGRAKNFRIESREGHAILRADAHLDKTSLEPGPNGGKPRGLYLMDLAESDPGAFQSSVVMLTDKLQREPDESGERRPPIYRPTKLLASDFVDEGDAVHGDLFSTESLDQFLEGSSRRLPSKLAVAGAQYLDQLFPDADRDVIEARIEGFKSRYLELRFGAAPQSLELEESDMDQETKSAIEALQKSHEEKLSALTKLIEQDRLERKAELSAAQQHAEITALCEMSGVAKPGEAGDMIKKGFSADDARKELFGRLINKQAPVADDDKTNDSFSTPPKVDENEKFRAEFTGRRNIYESLGITIDSYVRDRREELGLPASTEVSAA